MQNKNKSTNTKAHQLKVIDKPIFISNTDKDITIQPGCRFNKDINLTDYTGTIQCPQQVFFYGRLIFVKCECHIICEGEPNIFNKVILKDSILSMEGVPEDYSEQLSEDVLSLLQSKLYT